MSDRRPDLPSLVAGVGLVVFGAVLLLDALDVIHLSFAASPRSRASSSATSCSPAGSRAATDGPPRLA